MSSAITVDNFCRTAAFDLLPRPGVPKLVVASGLIGDIADAALIPNLASTAATRLFISSCEFVTRASSSPKLCECLPLEAKSLSAACDLRSEHLDRKSVV